MAIKLTIEEITSAVQHSLTIIAMTLDTPMLDLQQMKMKSGIKTS